MMPISSLPVHCSGHKLLLMMLSMICWNMASISSAQESENVSLEHQKWAVILVGHAGDQEHAEIFRETADHIKKWLIGPLQFQEDHVLGLPRDLTDESGPVVNLTADGIRRLLAELKTKLQPEDSLWILTIGHGNYDGKRAWFHVQGRDPSSEEFGRWMADVRCREQVIWLMHSSSGWFLKPLSRPGRIVIAATAADEEANETEFPYALATITQQTPAELDTNHDNAVSVSEIFSAVVSEVLRRFKSDNRLPTEHAQLDDDGDGVGTEAAQMAISTDSPLEGEKPAKKKIDGELARTTIVPYGVAKAGNPSPPSPKR